MKFLIIQENGRYEKNRNFRECFCLQRSLIYNNQECDVWGLNHTNYSDKIDFNSYDVIINLENYDNGWVPDLSKIQSFKIIWCIDAHYKTMAPYLKTFVDGKYQLILQATQKYLDLNSVWFPNCYDHTLIQPREVAKRADVGFCGNVLKRVYYLQALHDHFNFKADILVIGDDMVNAINSYRVHFNMNISDDINYRNFETIGCKIPLVTNYNSQYDDLGFEDGDNCVFYSSKKQMLDKIRYLLENTSLMELIAKSGYILSEKHTYNVRAKELLDILKSRI